MPRGGSGQRLDIEVGFTDHQALEGLAQAGQGLASTDAAQVALGTPRQDDAAHRARSVAIELGEYLGGGPRAPRPQVGVRVAH